MLKVPYVTNYLTEHFADDAFATVDGYVAKGGYAAARKAITEMSPDEVIEVELCDPIFHDPKGERLRS